MHLQNDADLLPAFTGLSNSINELLRFFFLVEDKPYPYTEKLMHLADTTCLGSKFAPVLKHCVDLMAGRVQPEADAFTRLKGAFDTLYCCDISQEANALDRACADAMLNVGIDPAWVEADFDNIGELLEGRLGPFTA